MELLDPVGVMHTLIGEVQARKVVNEEFSEDGDLIEIDNEIYKFPLVTVVENDDDMIIVSSGIIEGLTEVKKKDGVSYIAFLITSVSNINVSKY